MPIVTVFMLMFMMLLPSAARAEDAIDNKFDQETLMRDMDIMRLGDVQTIGALINAYKDKTGQYPFEGTSEEKVTVLIAVGEQKKAFEENKTDAIIDLIPYDAFIEALRSGLGRDIQMPFDPQQQYNGWPNYYEYTFHEGRYILTVHLYNSYDFSSVNDDDINQLMISNVSSMDPLIWNYDDLMSYRRYAFSKNEPYHNSDYMTNLRRLDGDKVGFQ